MTFPPKICFIGSGNLATQFSIALHEKGFEIVQVYSRTEEAASELARKLACAYTVQAANITSEADMYVCALKDSVITEVLRQAEPQIKGKLLVHTAGSVPMSLLEEFSENCGVIYPTQTFTKAKKVDFGKVPFLLEGSTNEVYSELEKIVATLSDNIYNVSSEDRKRIHLAAVFVCNFANHVFALGADLAKASGLPFEILLPLIDETAEKVHFVPPSKAQSGPAVRNDDNVMEMHRQMLEGSPQLLEIYNVLSRSIQCKAKQQ